MGPVIVGDVTVPGEVLVLFVGLLITVGVGITSWALVLLVRTTQLVARLEARIDSLEERVTEHTDLLRGHPEVRR